MVGSMLVTGGRGFIGSRIARAAREHGWRVRVIDSLRADVHANEPHTGDVDDVEFVHADLADESTLLLALRGVEVVCHQAAKVGLGVDFADAPDYVRSNDLATATLLAGMSRAGVGRLVLASSMVVYGEGRYRDALGPVVAPPREARDLDAGQFEPISPRTGEPLESEPISEDSPLDPRNVYAASKLMQEHLSAVWARETGGTVAALRYHNVYGPGMPRSTPYAGVAAIFRSSLEAGHPPQVFEDGGQRRDFVHVDDVAAANLSAAEWTRADENGPFRPFNVATGEVHTVGEMAEALASAHGGPNPQVTGQYRLGDVRHITASAHRIHDELGWRATVSFEDGMREFAAAALRAPVTPPR